MGALGVLELLFIIVVFVFPILALIDILKSNFKENIKKVVWLLTVILIPRIRNILVLFDWNKSEKNKLSIRLVHL